jgi:hypothetical protein
MLINRISIDDNTNMGIKYVKDKNFRKLINYLNFILMKGDTYEDFIKKIFTIDARRRIGNNKFRRVYANDSICGR